SFFSCSIFLLFVFSFFFLFSFPKKTYLHTNGYTPPPKYFLMSEKYCGDIDHYTKWDEKRLLIVGARGQGKVTLDCALS
ncbi:MAG: hypothetical protein O0W99_02145, partial [Methanocorpusculum sp.]|nr:hypothetical protein [Methanocorpusculum sp.]